MPTKFSAHAVIIAATDKKGMLLNKEWFILHNFLRHFCNHEGNR